MPSAIGLRQVFGYHCFASLRIGNSTSSATERRCFVAKGKSTNAAKLQSASAAKRKATAAPEGRSPTPAKKSVASAERQLCSDEIGHVAGQVWGLLHSHGEQTLAAIKKSIDAPADLIVAAIGWLAREGKLNFSNDGRTVNVSLR
jgi:phage gp16-like protein